MLADSCPEATSIPEDSGMSFMEQSGSPRENLASVEPSLLSRFVLLENLS